MPLLIEHLETECDLAVEDWATWAAYLQPGSDRTLTLQLQEWWLELDMVIE